MFWSNKQRKINRSKMAPLLGMVPRWLRQIYWWWLALVIHITRLVKFSLPILHFFSFIFLFCSFCFVLVFLSLFCRLSIACYIENKIWGRDYKELTLLIIFDLWSNCWGNGKSKRASLTFFFSFFFHVICWNIE